MENNRMTKESHITPAEDALIIRPSTDLISLPEGGSPALSEIISRSLAHIKVSRAQAIPERRAGEDQEFEIAPGVKIVMCWIPPGEFLMGSPEDETFRRDGETQHRVTITDGFWLGKYPVTQVQWEAVMGNNPSCFKGANLPVEIVDWNDISQSGGFMEKISHFAVAGGIFALPTEAQWEYACRAGTMTSLNSGKDLTTADEACPNLDEVAWYGINSGGKIHPVGQKKANAWGLHDMHGNVWEWCLDCYKRVYTDEPQVDPRKIGPGSIRVVRGGGWNGYARGCRAAGRYFGNPKLFSNNTGFRISRSSAP
jgi:formylglycine-generating enzyme required for sulfatase activity